MEVDSMVIFDDWEKWTAINTQYATDRAAYDTLRTAYNTANGLRIQLHTDILSAIFIDEPVVPVRPCNPDRPHSYTDLAGIIRGPTMEHQTLYPAFTQTDKLMGKVALKLNTAADVV
jgi:hypothetical protein